MSAKRLVLVLIIGTVLIALFRLWLKPVPTTTKRNPTAQRLAATLNKLKREYEKDPRNVGKATEYAFALYATHRDQQAIRVYRQVAKLNRRDSRSLNNLGNLYRKNRHSRLAIKAYRQSIKADPEQINAYVNLANLYFYELKDLRRGVAVFEQALDRHPENIGLYFMLANVYKVHRQPQKAESVYAKILALDPDNHTVQELMNSLPE